MEIKPAECAIYGANMTFFLHKQSISQISLQSKFFCTRILYDNISQVFVRLADRINSLFEEKHFEICFLNCSALTLHMLSSVCVSVWIISGTLFDFAFGQHFANVPTLFFDQYAAFRLSATLKLPDVASQNIWVYEEVGNAVFKLSY